MDECDPCVLTIDESAERARLRGRHQVGFPERLAQVIAGLRNRAAVLVRSREIQERARIGRIDLHRFGPDRPVARERREALTRQERRPSDDPPEAAPPDER